MRIQDLGFRIQARAQSRILDPKGRSKQDAGTQGTDCLAEGSAVGGCRLQTHQVFSQTEIYGLASQIQRAAVSIPLNIAEGHGLKQTQAYARHLAIANGSLAELETQLEIANRRLSQPGEPAGYRPGLRSAADVIGFTAELTVSARRC